MTLHINRDALTNRASVLRVPFDPAIAPKHELLPATSIHPYAVALPVAAYFWLILASWFAFAAGETSLVLGVVTFLSLMYFALLVGGAALARNMTPERRTQRSFAEFLQGDVDIETGRITGREAFWQIAVMPIALGIGGTLIILMAVVTS